MVSLQQIKELENRVLKAVEVINSLREENKSLRENLQGYEDRILELEELVETFKKEQQQIENGILDAIKKLDVLEDSHNAELEKNSKPRPIDSELKIQKQTAVDVSQNENGVTLPEQNDIAGTEEELDIF
ncbi:MAG: cell division protein ZapB [Spirochaetales bacterium]|nr:cell division protein ZapB [Spirochaetales bacterium]